MGPFPPADIDSKNPPYTPALKWTDDCKNDKKLLKTNKSEEDLELKDLNNLPKVTAHRDKPKSCLKNTIKPFKLDVNQLTGIKNFTDISQDPYAIPADREFTFSSPETIYQKNAKAFNATKAIEQAETKEKRKGSARKELSSKKEGSSRKDEGIKISSRDQITSPSNDMFYKKQQSET